MSEIDQPHVRLNKRPAKDRALGMGVAFAGTGAGKPQYRLPDEIIEHYINNFDSQRAGKSFHVMRKEKLGTEVLYETTLQHTIEDCMVDAARLALVKSNMGINDIAEIHISTVSPRDKICRARSKIIEKLGYNIAPIIELSHGCAGSLYAIESARRAVLIKGKPMLAIAGDDVRQYVIDLKDWAQAGIFGAGAGAAVLVPAEKNLGLYPLNFWTDPLITKCAYMKPMTEKFHMEGKKLGYLAPETYHSFFTHILEEYNIDRDNVCIIPHQLNGNLIELFRQQAKLRMDQILNIVNRFGNTSNGSVLLALDHALTYRLKLGDIGILFGVGAGFDFGYTVYLPDRDLRQQFSIKILLAEDDPQELGRKAEMYRVYLPELVGFPQNATLVIYVSRSKEETIEMSKIIKPDLLDFTQRIGNISAVKIIKQVTDLLGPIPAIINSAPSDAEEISAYENLKLITIFPPDYIMKGNESQYLDKVLEFMYRSNII
jgi:3-oxoacyl-[acyl-carrier-protein] synthase-3